MLSGQQGKGDLPEVPLPPLCAGVTPSLSPPPSLEHFLTVPQSTQTALANPVKLLQAPMSYWYDMQKHNGLSLPAPLLPS